MYKAYSDKQIKRMTEITEKLEAIHETAELREGEDRGVFTETEQSDWNSLLEEYNDIRSKVESLKGLECRTLADIRANLKLPVNEAIKINPDGQRYNDNSEIRIFSKDNLNELGPYIRSQGKLGMGNEELSAGRYIKGLITGDWRNSLGEYELRALTTDVSGTVFLPEEISSTIIPLALKQSRAVEAGILIIPMSTKKLTIPKQLTSPETEWKAEGAPFSKSMDLSFGPLELVCHTLMSLISLSVELSQDSENVSQEIQKAITRQLALDIDLAVLSGETPSPTGIINTTGIQLEEATFPLTDYSNFSSAFTKIENVNGTPGALVISSDLLGVLDKLVSATELQPLLPPESWKSYKHLSSNQLISSGILGDFSQAVLGVRTTMNLALGDLSGKVESSREAEDAFSKMLIFIRSYLRASVGIKVPEFFCHIKEEVV